jgi:hypothetical protein
MKCGITGVGLFGPGFASWQTAREILAGNAPYMPAEASVPPATLLPAAERRRATGTTRLALTVAQEALAMAGADPTMVATVFASSSGSADIIHDTCTMLAANDFQISPTKFHNSVHNAASGYYSIAAASMRAATSLCAYDGSVAAGLLEAATQLHAAQVHADPAPVLLVCFDMPYPFPLSLARPMQGAWASALLLTPHTSGAGTGISIELRGAAAETTLRDAALEHARLNNPSARVLPLLAAIALGGGEVLLRQQNGSTLTVRVQA